ncbi:hypothetical protein N9L68_08465 [bacterium]|nr:hypothetical protein [bacterium]
MPLCLGRNSLPALSRSVDAGPIRDIRGSPTLSQSNWHPRRGELYAQRETLRESRKHLGRIPAECWTDHSAAVKDSTGEVETDATIIRWVGDIESAGCHFLNLSGRSAIIGDGLSRHNEEHGKFLREQAHSLSSITLGDLLGDGYEVGDTHTRALDVTPDVDLPAGKAGFEVMKQAKASVGAVQGTRASQLASIGGAVGRAGFLTALLFPGNSFSRQRQADLAYAEQELRLPAPALRCHLRLEPRLCQMRAGDSCAPLRRRSLRTRARRPSVPLGATS